MEFDQEGIEAAVSRFEEMLKRQEEYFFDVEQFDRIAEHYLERGYNKKALKCLDIGCSQHPSHAQLLYRKAQVHAASGKMNLSLDLLKNLEAREPFNTDILLLTANIYGQLRNYEKSIHYFQKAIDHATENIDEILIDMAFEYESADRYEEAIVVLHQALEKNPDNETAIYELAHVYELAGRVEESVEAYQELIDENPYSFTAWYNLGNSYVKLELHEKALEAYSFCLVIKEDFSSAHFNKANSHVQLEQYDKAIEEYRECLDLEGPLPVTHCYLGESYEKLEHFDLAIRHYQKAIELDPEWTDAWVGIGVVKDLEGKTLESLNYLRKAVVLEKENADNWLILAKALHKSEFYLESKQAFEEVIALTPDNVESWLELADLEAAYISTEAGAEVIKRGLEFYEEQPELKYRLTAFLLRMGRIQEALEHLEDALLLNYEDHMGLFDHYPESRFMPEVLELIELYKEKS